MVLKPSKIFKAAIKLIDILEKDLEIALASSQKVIYHLVIFGILEDKVKDVCYPLVTKLVKAGS